MSELIIVIATALWCGNPTGTPISFGAQPVYAKDVRECRKQLLTCFNSSKGYAVCVEEAEYPK